jgi:hypothetical protein
MELVYGACLWSLPMHTLKLFAWEYLVSQSFDFGHTQIPDQRI